MQGKFSKPQRGSISYPTINWGRGRLLPYESEGSFAAKFCVLNDISPRQFREFFSSFLDGELNFHRITPEVLKRIALLLNESHRTVAKLNKAIFDVPGCFGTFTFEQDSDFDVHNGIHQIKYCPECLAVGFHSSFHEHSLIQKCPLHLIKLEVIYKNSGGASHYDRYIQTVYKLLAQSGSQWLSFEANPLIVRAQECSHFKSFLKWLRDAQRVAAQWEKLNVLHLTGDKYNALTIEELLDRLSWSLPIPKIVKRVYGVDIPRTTPTIIKYPSSLIKKLQTLLVHFTYDDLLLLYKALAKDPDVTFSFSIYINQAIANIDRRARESSSHWAWANGVWHTCNPDHWPYWGYINPYEFVAQLLKKEWLTENRTGNLFRVFFKARNAGVLIATDVQERDFPTPYPSNNFLKELGISGFSMELPAFPYNIKLNLDFELSELLQDLFLEEAMADVAQKLTWAKLLASGTSPEKIPEPPPVGNLFLTENEGMLYLWRRPCFNY